MVNEYAYCPRLFYLEWIHGEWAENADTLEGAQVHARVEAESGRLPPPELLAPGDRFVARGLPLASERLGLVARVDIVEAEGGRVRPVDYKKGRPGPRGPWEPELVQLCVQGLLLREHGYRADEGILYYAASRQRIVVPFDDALISRTMDLVAELREAALRSVPPPPLRESPKCPSCVLVGICLPDEVALLRGAPIGEAEGWFPRAMTPRPSTCRSREPWSDVPASGWSSERRAGRRRPFGCWTSPSCPCTGTYR
jgi:CRISPR-associated protein Cas4